MESHEIQVPKGARLRLLQRDSGSAEGQRVELRVGGDTLEVARGHGCVIGDDDSAGPDDSLVQAVLHAFD
jgi:hypothetical protein